MNQPSRPQPSENPQLIPETMPCRSRRCHLCLRCLLCVVLKVLKRRAGSRQSEAAAKRNGAESTPGLR
jgi:hypothetical protein